MSVDDNKTRSITMLVRSLIVLTVMVLILTVVLIYYMNSSAAKAEIQEPMTAPCGMSTGKVDYVVGASNGKQLFKANCSSCHTVTDKQTYGPGLRGVLSRIPGGEWKYRFVRNHDEMVKEGDPYAVALFRSNNKSGVAFPNLTNDDIDAILMYCD